MNNYYGVNISVIGSSHIKTNTECQDSSSYYSSEQYGVTVVCDGHGSEKHFRSAKGSEIATIITIDAIKELMKYENSFTDNKNNVLIQLEKNIILNWNNAVNNHLRENPFTDYELGKLSDKNRKSVESNVESVYGSTLIATVLTDEYCFGIQIGDGDCIVFGEQGEIFKPVPEDDRLQFNITTSLCDKMALRNFRHFWIQKPVVALLVSTDGVRNSFSDEAFYQKFCKTVLDSFIEMPYDEAKKELTEFLERLTSKGSGDDVSIATTYNVRYLKNTLKNNTDNIEDTSNVDGELTDNTLEELVSGNQEVAEVSLMEDIVDELSKTVIEGITK